MTQLDCFSRDDHVRNCHDVVGRLPGLEWLPVRIRDFALTAGSHTRRLSANPRDS
jgi:hypothetical protein